MVEHLVERIRNHDQRAMGILYQRYVGMLSSVCYRYVPNEYDAKDVLQNSFVKIFTAMPVFDYRGEQALKSWLVRVVVNEALNFLKERKKLQYVEQDVTRMPQVAVEEEPEPDSEGISADELHRMVRSLPDGYRTVFNLYVFEGCSHKQIAEQLGVKEATSASQLYHAKRLLARKIKNIIKEER